MPEQGRTRLRFTYFYPPARWFRLPYDSESGISAPCRPAELRRRAELSWKPTQATDPDCRQFLLRLSGLAPRQHDKNPGEAVFMAAPRCHLGHTPQPRIIANRTSLPSAAARRGYHAPTIGTDALQTSKPTPALHSTGTSAHHCETSSLRTNALEGANSDRLRGLFLKVPY